ncbi:MAG: AbrB/MazE/SpoVT family DNA-binding domain-containing protein [Hyphomonas sp.]|uniref:AbrB/MazE/SpoVT family DNA-binding domain-containing protein n=1 Tax=Hyphomonas sp. TaxID=87 RepID=UPI000BC82419|nr:MULTISPECIES: AbrB/MazE/SpoVT family DNA-binding domain-containing protein [unclassified Hyphomonas]MBA4225990.1 AbrB/MazE/SpoVT family DNA-binding domain-containing protein [Hyphomonas sp.]OZB14400.1 MAG: transcriptional regulator [Hyphomonas sp. 34-62-18]
MTKLKIRKIGNSLGVVLPKEVLDQLKVKEGDTLDVVPTETGVKLSISDEEVDKLMQMAERIMEENREVLRALAK